MRSKKNKNLYKISNKIKNNRLSNLIKVKNKNKLNANKQRKAQLFSNLNAMKAQK